jgi:hypothetical protein
MLTRNDKSPENLACLEISEISNKSGKISSERRSYHLPVNLIKFRKKI